MVNGTYVAGHEELQRARWSSAGNVLAGVWLIVAPFALNFGANDAAMWNHIVVGAMVLVLAAIRAFDPDRREGISWVNVILGVWMIVSPYLLGYGDVNPAQTNSLITGALILILAAFSAYQTNEAHRAAGGLGGDVT